MASPSTRPSGTVVLLERGPDTRRILQSLEATFQDQKNGRMRDWFAGTDSFLLMAVAPPVAAIVPASDYQALRIAIAELAADLHDKLGDLSAIEFTPKVEDAALAAKVDGFWAGCLRGLATPDDAPASARATVASIAPGATDVADAEARRRMKPH